MAAAAQNAVFETNLPGLKLVNRGKVRDVYDLGKHLLIVASDRLSAYDSVLASPIPEKGRVLTRMSTFWFRFTHNIIPNHFVTTDLDEMKKLGYDLSEHREILEGRTTLAEKAEVLPVECVVRGYLAGSGWREYQKTGEVCGLKLRKGYLQGSRLDEPIFTPATKSTHGHDENISISRAAEIIGSRETADFLREKTIAIYRAAAEYADQRGIIIVDTKMEFGRRGGEIILIDELLTPDSSRFWPRKSWTPGEQQLSFDKQFVRDYLDASGWDRNPPGPALPDKVVRKTTEKYLEAERLLAGE